MSYKALGRMIWSLSKVRGFKVSIYYSVLRTGGDFSFPWRAVWRAKSPPSVSFFMSGGLRIMGLSCGLGVNWVMPRRILDLLLCWLVFLLKRTGCLYGMQFHLA